VPSNEFPWRSSPGDQTAIEARADFDRRPIAKLAEIHRATLDPEFQAFLARVPTLADPMRR
jgi:hypothetical protein